MILQRPLGSLVLAFLALATGIAMQRAWARAGAPSSFSRPLGTPDTQILGIPAPEQMVQIREGLPFIVPTGAIFVATAVAIRSFPGSNFDMEQYAVLIDCVAVLMAELSAFASPDNPGFMHIPPGLTAGAGSRVEVAGRTADVDGLLLGYVDATPPGSAMQVAGIPTPSQMVRLTHGTPLSVPQGKIFVATGLAYHRITPFGAENGIDVDGVNVIKVALETAPSAAGNAQIVALPPGITAPTGSTVQVYSGAPPAAVVFGYLADMP